MRCPSSASPSQPAASLRASVDRLERPVERCSLQETDDREPAPRAHQTRLMRAEVNDNRDTPLPFEARKTIATSSQRRPSHARCHSDSARATIDSR